MEEGVELGECFAAFGAQRIRRIQYPRNPLLLRQRRKGDFEVVEVFVAKVVDVRASSEE